MASIILASIAVALTLGIYLYGAWRFLRFPRFWIVFARADIKAEPRGKPNEVILGTLAATVAYRGGGQARNIIDAGLVVVEGGEKIRIGKGLGGGMQDVIHIPAELAGRFTIEFPAGLVVDWGDTKLSASLRFDCGGEYFEVPFQLKRSGDYAVYVPSPLVGPLLSLRLRRTWLQRILDWIRSR